MLCPYCDIGLCDSADHNFPAFLGGRVTVSVCTKCNNTFGHTFEAETSKHLRGWMFLLRRCGLQPPTPLVWKGMSLDQADRRYDVDQDFQVTPSKPEIVRDATGRIVRAVGGKKQIEQITRSLEKDGRQVSLPYAESVSIDIRRHQLTHPIDANMRRLCIKMSLAAARRLGLMLPVNRPLAGYLLEGKVANICPVRIASERYEGLDKQRPRIGHLVYLRASNAERRIFSVVQFFGVMQFYCQLADDWTGPDHAILATHDPISHEEFFGSCPPLDYDAPPTLVDVDVYSKSWRDRLERFRLELVSIYGDQAPVSLDASLIQLDVPSSS